MHLRRARVRRLPAERGETLIELLVTIVLLGTGIAAILTGLLALTQAAEVAKGATQANVLLQSYAEQLEQPINTAVAPSATGGSNAYYIPCGTPAQYNVAPYAFSPPSATPLPTGWTVQVVKVQYLTAIGSSGGSPSWNDTCPSAGDIGLQQIFIEAYANSTTHQDKEQLVIVKRNAACPALQNTPTTLTANFPDAGPC